MFDLPAPIRVRGSIVVSVAVLFTLLYTSSPNRVAASEISYSISNSAANASSMSAASPISDIRNIRFDPSTSMAERNRIITEMNGRLINWIEPLQIASVQLLPEQPINGLQLGGGHLRTLDQNSQDLHQTMIFMEDNQTIHGAFLPDDPGFSEPDLAYNFHKLELFDAWNLEQGNANVTIAVIDTGISPEHPEFAARLRTGFDFVNNDADPQDDHGHGTHVAGIIGGAIDNGSGVAGVCPKCAILSVKVLDAGNVGTWFTAAQGVVYAVDNGADIINLSLGATTASSTIEAAIDYAHSKGVLVVAAAGNAGTDEPFYPAAYEKVMSVGATTIDDELWNLSNFGESVDITAPGEFIYNASPELTNSYGGYTYKSGTSMASPHVAGLAGLLLSQDSSRDLDELKRIIRVTADDLGNTGWDETFGYGRINALTALQYGEAVMNGLAEPITTRKAQHALFMPVISSSGP